MRCLIAAPLLQQIEAHCVAAWPQEACGLLLGMDDPSPAFPATVQIIRHFPAANVAPSGHDRFELDPAVRIAVEKQLRADPGPVRLLGHYHSHPNGCPTPSATDADMVYEPHLLWMIVATRGPQKQAESRLFAWTAGQLGRAGGFSPIHLQKITSHL